MLEDADGLVVRSRRTQPDETSRPNRAPFAQGCVRAVRAGVPLPTPAGRHSGDASAIKRAAGRNRPARQRSDVTWCGARGAREPRPIRPEVVVTNHYSRRAIWFGLKILPHPLLVSLQAMLCAFGGGVLQRLPLPLHGLIELSGSGVRGREPFQGLGVLPIGQLARPPGVLDREGRVPVLRVRTAGPKRGAVVEGGPVLRVEPDRLAEVPERPLVIPRRPPNPAAVAERRGELRVAPDGLVQVFQGLAPFAAVGPGGPAPLERAGAPGFSRMASSKSRIAPS